MSPYQVAREVARQIIHHPGATARELYRLHGDGFAEHNYDGARAAALISQHLAKFETEGMVVSERKGKAQSDPKHWTWVGPAPAAVDEHEAEQAEIERDAEKREPEAPRTAPSECVEQLPTVVLDPSDPFDALLITIRDAAASPPFVARRDEKLACLARLAEITARDISDLLLEICSDLEGLPPC